MLKSTVTWLGMERSDALKWSALGLLYGLSCGAAMAAIAAYGPGILDKVIVPLR